MSNCEECVGYMESHSIFYWGPKVLELKTCVKFVIEGLEIEKIFTQAYTKKTYPKTF